MEHISSTAQASRPRVIAASTSHAGQPTPVAPHELIEELQAPGAFPVRDSRSNGTVVQPPVPKKVRSTQRTLVYAGCGCLAVTALVGASVVTGMALGANFLVYAAVQGGRGTGASAPLDKYPTGGLPHLIGGAQRHGQLLGEAFGLPASDMPATWACASTPCEFQDLIDIQSKLLAVQKAAERAAVRQATSRGVAQSPSGAQEFFRQLDIEMEVLVKDPVPKGKAYEEFATSLGGLSNFDVADVLHKMVRQGVKSACKQVPSVAYHKSLRADKAAYLLRHELLRRGLPYSAAVYSGPEAYLRPSS